MPDLASLSFDIDSSAAQRAIAVLESMKATSIAVTQSTTQLTAANTNLTTSYGQERDALVRLASETKQFQGTLQGLVTTMDRLRTGMNQTDQQFRSYIDIVKQATAVSSSFNATVAGLELYVQKAQQLRVQTQDLATGFSNITQALQNQTAQGYQTRVMLDQLGVSLAGVGGNRPDVVLQRLQEALRGTRLSAATIQGVQGVLGPVGAQAVQALQNQPYIGYREGQDASMRMNQEAMANAQFAAAARRNLETDRLNAERQDLSRYFGLERGGTLGRLGLNPMAWARQTFGYTRQEELDRLRQIRDMPEEERRQYQYAGTNFGDAQRRLQQAYSQGTMGSRFSEIWSRFGAERQNGFWGPLNNLIDRSGANLFGGYQPLATEDTRRMSRFEREFLRTQAGDVLQQGAGDPDLSDIIGRQELIRRTGSQDITNRYVQGFGFGEGVRRQVNRLADLQQQQLYARAPGLRDQADIDRESWIQSLPFAQRNRARAALQVLPEAQRNIPPGTPLSAVEQDPSLQADRPGIPGQRGNRVFQAAQDIGSAQRLETVQQEIQFQKELAEQLKNGQGAASDYLRSYEAFLPVLKESGSAEKANAEGLAAVNLAMAQRITQGKALITTMERETTIQREQLNIMAGLTGADLITRRQAQLTGDINADRDRLIASGQLAPPGGGRYQPRDANGRPIGDPITVSAQEGARQSAEYTTARQRQAGVQGTAAIQGMQEQRAQAAQDAQRVLEIMRQQGTTQAAAISLVQQEKALKEAITKEMADQNNLAVTNLETERKKTEESQRQADLNARAIDSLQQAATLNLQSAGTGAITGLPPALRGAGRDVQQILNPYIQSGQISVGGGPGAALAGTPDLVTIQSASGASFRVDRSVATQIQGLINDLEAGGVKIDPRTSGGYSNRNIAGTSTPSQHAYGRAVDINAVANARGTQGQIDPALARSLATKYGLTWGGDWRGATRDPMHFEAPGQAALTTGAGGAVDINTLLSTAARGGTVTLPGLTAEQNQALNEQLQAALLNRGVNITGQTADLAAQSGARLQQIQAQQRFLLSPALRARQIGLDPTLPPAEAQRRAGFQQQEVMGQQRLGVAVSNAELKLNIEDTTRLSAALSRSRAAYNEESAAIQARNDALRLGPDLLDENQRKTDLMTQALGKNKLAMDEASEAQRNQNDVQRAVNARGIFADDISRDEAARSERLRQQFRDTGIDPGSPEGQRAISASRDTTSTQRETEQMNVLRDAARQAGQAIEDTLSSIIVKGQVSTQTLANLAQQLAKIALNAAIFKPLETMLGNVFSGDDTMKGVGGVIGLLGKIGGGAAVAGGGAGVGADLLAQGLYAKGGVFGGGIEGFSNEIVTRPAFFKAYAKGGVMGEAGPEAVVPLVRDSSGNLGVRGGGGGSIQINTPIHINSQGGGGGQQGPVDPAAMRVLQQKIDQTVRASVMGVLTEQKRPGGQLFLG